MANRDLEQLVAQLNGDIRGYKNAMAEAVGVTNKRAREIESRWKQMNGSIASAVTGPLAGIGAALSVREITQYADAWTRARNVIAAAAQSSGVQVRSLEELSVGANDARQSLESYAQLYASLIRSASGVARSEEEVATATNLVAKAMKAGGAGVAEQQSAIQQLGQALGSGVLQGDELRSLRENAPVLAQAIADEFKVTIGELKGLGEEGKLTSDRVFRAIINAQQGIETQFAQTNATISDGFTKLGNSVTEFVGKLFETTGATAAINTVLGALAGHIDGIAAAAAAAGALILSAYVPAIVRATAATALMVATNPFLAVAAAIGAAAFALTAFGDDFTVIQGDMATFGDYAATIWDQVTTGVSTASSAISDWFLGALTLVSEAMDGVAVTWADVGSFIKQSVNEYIGIFAGMAAAVTTIFQSIGGAVADGLIGAMNGVIEMVEKMIQAVIGGVNKTIDALNSIPGVGIENIGQGFSLGRIANNYEGEARDFGGKVGDAFSEGFNRDYVGGALKNLRDQAETEAFVRKIGSAIETPPPITNEGFGGGAPAAAGAGGGGKKGRKAKESELAKEIEQIKKRTAALQAETAAQALVNPLIDDYGYAVEKAGAMQELLTAAQEAGLTVTPQLRAQMEGLSEAYAQAVVASGKLGESHEKIKERAEDMRNSSREISQGVVQDLLNQKSAAEAFANALGKVGDKLLDMALDAAFSKGGLFGNIGGAGGGGLGGIFSAIGGLFGGARARGGPVSAGKAYLVGEKRPELFVPGQSGRIIPRIPSGSSSGGGSTAITIDVRGATGNEEVQRMVAAGVSQGMSQVRREVPGIVTKHQLRHG